MIVHYAEFLYPGFFVSETNEVEILERNPNSIVLPEGSFGFRFYDIEEVLLDGEILKGKKKNVSGWYYDGEIKTLADVKKEMPNEKILISNMECNNWERIVKIKNGQCFPLYEEDKIISR